MGIDTWRSRAGVGRLGLLAVLAVAPGCALTGEAAATPDVSATSETPLVPAALPPTAQAPATLVSEFPDDAPPQPLCDDPLLGVDFSLDESALPTLYVDPATNALAADGSLAAPFRTLAAALLTGVDAVSAAAPPPGARLRVLVASGHYDEDVAIPPGTLLFGGYDGASWQMGQNPSVIGGSVYVGTAKVLDGIVTPQGAVAPDAGASPSPPNAAPLTALIHFEVSSGVEVVPGTRALLRDNVIAPLFFGSTYDAPSALRAMAVWVDVATVRADHNRLLVPVNDPANVISNGFYTWESCAWITENVISDYRSPIFFYRGAGAAATYNVLERAENGVGVAGNQALIAANSIHTEMPSGGCVYAMTMEGDAHPDIRDNSIYLKNIGNRGILEEDVASRPSALLGNHFYAWQTSPALYIDHRGMVDPELITKIDAVNTIFGVPAIGDNTFSFVAAMP